LGTILTENNETTKEIEARTQAGNKCFFGLAKLLGAQSLSINFKKQLYLTLIRLIVTSGAETWASKFLVFERKILSIFGPVKDSVTNGWRIRKNKLESL